MNPVEAFRWGARLRAAMRAGGWAQRNLAFRVDCARSTLGMVLIGLRRPNAELQGRLADHLNRPAAALFPRTQAEARNHPIEELTR